MEWARSIANRLKRNLKFSSSHGRQHIVTVLNERIGSWFNSLYLYCKLQPILSLTCVILFFSLILMLLIYRYNRRKRLDQRTMTTATTTITKKQQQQQLKTTHQQATKGKLIDYDQHNTSKRTTSGDRQPTDRNDQMIRQSEHNNRKYSMNGTPTDGRIEFNGKLNYGNKFNENLKCQQSDKRQAAGKFDYRLTTGLNDPNDPRGRSLRNQHFCTKNDCCSADEIRKNEAVKFTTNLTTKFRPDLNDANQLNYQTIRHRPFTNQSNRPQTEPFANESSTECCGCCCRMHRCIANRERLRRETLKQQLENDFCDCEFCEYRDECDVVPRQYTQDYGSHDVRAKANRFEDKMTDSSARTSSFGSCEADRCGRKCKIAKLIKDNVSARSNSLNGTNQHLNKHLFDNEYRRLVRKNRQFDQQTGRDCLPIDEHFDNNYPNKENDVNNRFNSWSSHRHLSSPVP